MAGGKRRHSIRRFQRRVDKVLAEEEESRKPPPPAISQQHAELRERIDAAYQALLGAEASENADPITRILENPELATDALKVQDMIFEEQKMLEAQGVDWRPFQS